MIFIQALAALVFSFSRKLGFIGAALGLLLSLGCAKENKIPEGGVRAHLPLYQPGQDYQLQEVTIKTIRDLPNIKGEASEFFYSPRIAANNRFDGIRPTLRFFYDAVARVVPTDAFSLKLLTLYYHFENMMFWDQDLGVRDKIAYPRQVAVEARTRDESGTVSFNNARYLSRGDNCLFEKYTLDALPLVVNSGVVAHEHFHALFQKLVLENLKADYLPPEEVPIPAGGEDESQEVQAKIEPRDNRPLSLAEYRLYHQWKLRAVNEGLADVWGWLYSKDKEFVTRSLPGKNQEFRSLTPLSSREQLRTSAFARSILFAGNRASRRGVPGHVNQQRGAMAYYAGSLIARALAEAARVHYKNQFLTPEQTKEFSSLILSTLPSLREELNANSQDKLFPITKILTKLFSVDRQNFWSVEACKVVYGVLEESERRNLCHLSSIVQSDPPVVQDANPSNLPDGAGADL